MKTALLFGASGLVGGHCLRCLLSSDRYDKVKIFVRKELPVTHEKLEQHLIDFDKMDEVKDLMKGDDLYLCLGTTMKKAGSKAAFRKVDFDYAYNAAEIAATHGAKQLMLVSSIGADATSFFYYNKIKGELEEAIKELTYKTIHILRPSVLDGDRKEQRIGESIAIKAGKAIKFVLKGPLLKYTVIKAEKVAAAMLHFARQDLSGVHIHESNVLFNLKIDNQ